MTLVFLSTTLLKGSLSTLRLGMQVGVTIMENSAEVLRARYVALVVSNSVTLQTLLTWLLCPWDSPGKDAGDTT